MASSLISFLFMQFPGTFQGFVQKTQLKLSENSKQVTEVASRMDIENILEEKHKEKCRFFTQWKMRFAKIKAPIFTSWDSVFLCLKIKQTSLQHKGDSSFS